MGTLRQTHTYVELEISKVAYDEIAGKLRAAGYDHVFMVGGAIDMHGLALINFVERSLEGHSVIFDPRVLTTCDCAVGMCTHRKDCRQL